MLTWQFIIRTLPPTEVRAQYHLTLVVCRLRSECTSPLQAAIYIGIGCLDSWNEMILFNQINVCQLKYLLEYTAHTHTKITEHNVSNNSSIPMHTYRHRLRHILLSFFASCCRQSITCLLACVCATVMEFIAHMVCSGYSPENACRQQNGILTTLFVVFFSVEITQKNERRRQRRKIWIQFFTIFFSLNRRETHVYKPIHRAAFECEQYESITHGFEYGCAVRANEQSAKK